MPEQLSPTPRAGVAGRQHGHRLRPHDPQFRVIESHGDVLTRFMRTVDPVTDIGCGSQNLKSMQKSRRNVEMTKLLVIEKKCTMLTEGRRLSADIDDDVVNRAVRAPDQLGFAESRTAMQTADHAVCRSGLRVLDEFGRSALPANEFVEKCGLKSSGEQTAGVMHRLGYEGCDTGEVGLFNSHGNMLP